MERASRAPGGQSRAGDAIVSGLHAFVGLGGENRRSAGLQNVLAGHGCVDSTKGVTCIMAQYRHKVLRLLAGAPWRNPSAWQYDARCCWCGLALSVRPTSTVFTDSYTRRCSGAAGRLCVMHHWV